MGVLFSQFVGDISAWTNQPKPLATGAPAKSKGDGTVSRNRKDDTLNKIRRQLDAADDPENGDRFVDPVEATRCIADPEDQDPDLPDCEPLYQY